MDSPLLVRRHGSDAGEGGVYREWDLPAECNPAGAVGVSSRAGELAC